MNIFNVIYVINLMIVKPQYGKLSIYEYDNNLPLEFKVKKSL
jgi:hypothetical protein